MKGRNSGSQTEYPSEPDELLTSARPSYSISRRKLKTAGTKTMLSLEVPMCVMRKPTRAAIAQNQTRYGAEMTAGGLKLRESRVVADLLLSGVDQDAWIAAIRDKNVLQARNRETAIRVGRLVRQRLETMDADLWKLVRDGNKAVATDALLAAAIKHSPLVGDFLDLVLREQFRLFAPKLTRAMWDEYLSGCRAREPEMPIWNESTRRRLRSSVFQSLAQAGFLNDTRALQ